MHSRIEETCECCNNVYIDKDYCYDGLDENMWIYCPNCHETVCIKCIRTCCKCESNGCKDCGKGKQKSDFICIICEE